MASNPAELCSIALTGIGVGGITSLTEASEEARVCSIHYDVTRRHALSLRDWSFALKRVKLVPSRTKADDIMPGGQWAESYAYPSSCVRFVRIIDTDDFEADPRFSVATGASGKIVLTDKADAWCECIHDEEDVSFFDDLFKSAFAWLLASKVAMTLTGRMELVEMAGAMHRESLRDAASMSLMEQQDIPIDKMRRVGRAGSDARLLQLPESENENAE